MWSVSVSLLAVDAPKSLNFICDPRQKGVSEFLHSSNRRAHAQPQSSSREGCMGRLQEGAVGSVAELVSFYPLSLFFIRSKSLMFYLSLSFIALKYETEEIAF